MGADPPALGKGLFGYRKSAVNQMLSDRDIMLRQAEGRVRAAESKVSQLQGELTSMAERNLKVEEQLDRLRNQLNALAAAQASAPSVATAPPPVETWPAPAVEPQAETYPEPQAETYPEPQAETYPEPPADTYAPPVEAPLYPEAETEGRSRYWQPETEPATPDEPPIVEPMFAPAPAWETGPQPSEWHAEEPSGQYGPEGEPAMPEAVPPDATPATEMAQDEMAEQGPSTPTEGEMETQRQTPPSAGGAPVGTSPESPIQPWEYPEGFDADAFGYRGRRREEPSGVVEQPAPSDEAPAPPDAYEAGLEAASIEQQDVQADESWEVPSAEGEDMAVEPDVPRMEPYHEEAERPSIEPEGQPAGVPSEPVSHPPAQAASRFVTEELAGILSAAEESAGRIIERAQTSSDQQIDRATKLWNEVQAEVSRFASWRDEVEPVIRTVQSKVENVRAYIEEVPERIREALAPMAESISSIDTDLAELSAACSPPMLNTPARFDGSEQRHAAPSSQPSQPPQAAQPSRAPQPPQESPPAPSQEATPERGPSDDPFGPQTFGSST